MSKLVAGPDVVESWIGEWELGLYDVVESWIIEWELGL